MYIHGYGVDQNEAEAERWALNSAENGNVNAMYQLGEDYATYAVLVEDMDITDTEEHYK